MQRELVRLECLKLAHRHDRMPEAVVKVAKEYESYILENLESTSSPAEASMAAHVQKSVSATKKKKADNSILD